VLTPAGLSLIIAMCTCCGHDSPRLRRFRTHACAPRTRWFFRFARTRESTEVREVSSALEPSVGQGRLRPNFVCYMKRLEATRCVLVTAAQPATPINTTPNPRYAYFQSRFTESTDGKTPALPVRNRDFGFSRRHTSLP